MDNLKSCKLNDRALLHIGGSECVAFLQNLITCNIDDMASGESRFGALLSPQGKILYDFFLVRTDDGFLVDITSALRDEFIKRLTFYKLRADVTLEADVEMKVFAYWSLSPQGVQPDVTSDYLITDPRLAEMGWRAYSKNDAPVTDANEADYHAHRIELGLPQGGIDYAYGDAFPHEALFDQINGVDFKKGCYVGQEVVSRMQHRGTARKRVVKVSANFALPDAPQDVIASGKTCGTLTSVCDQSGLALLRLDRVKRAIDHGDAVDQPRIGELLIEVTLQEWVNFSWPGDETAAPAKV